MFGILTPMAPISFGVYVPAEDEHAWQQTLAEAGVSLVTDEKLSEVYKDDADFVFVGKIETSLGAFPFDVTRWPHGGGLILQVYFGRQREHLTALFYALFPDELPGVSENAE